MKPRLQRIVLSSAILLACRLLMVAQGIAPQKSSATLAAKSSIPTPHNKPAIDIDGVKQLLLLMDTDKNGKVSKQEFMTFMQAEFERLDKDKRGELDVKELAQLKLRVSHFASVGK
jgi:hypothetical protein